MTIKASDYPALREWFAYVFDNYTSTRFSVDRESHPITSLDAISAKFPARARQGLEMAINDTIEMAQGWTTERLRQVDRELEAKGLPTFSAMRARFSKKIGRVLDRGRINSEVEYYAVCNVIDFVEESDRARLTELIAAYEAASR
jgi:hypothetical protein